MQTGTLQQLSQPVPYYHTVTPSSTPAVVGIPLSHALKPTPDYADLAEEVRRQRLRIMSTPTHVLLALRTLWTVVLSQFDYIASGVAVLPHHIQDSAVQVRLHYRHVLGLPCWTSRALQSLPMALGGPGCPDLTRRAAVRLLLTYTQASFSRNLLAQRSAKYLCSARVPGSEAKPLAAAAAALAYKSRSCPTKASETCKSAWKATARP